MKLKSFVYYKQSYEMDCGPTCLKMIARHFNKDFNPEEIKNISDIRKNGTSLLDLSIAAKNNGLYAAGLEIDLSMLKRVALPIILHWNLNHFVVLFKIRKKTYYIADPAVGIVKVPESEFMENWQPISLGTGKKRVALLFSEKKDFYLKKESI